MDPVVRDMLLSAAEGLGESALKLAPSFFEALGGGHKQEALDIAEEMARREAFELRQRAKRVKTHA